MCKLRIATNEYFKKRKEDDRPNQHTEWHTAVFWGADAERIADWGSVGRSIYVAGPLRKRTYTDDQQNERLAVEVIVREWEFTSRSDKAPVDKPGSPEQSTDAFEGSEADRGDIPF